MYDTSPSLSRTGSGRSTGVAGLPARTVIAGAVSGGSPYVGPWRTRVSPALNV